MLFLAFLAFPPAIVQCIIYSTVRSTPSTQAITLAIMNKKRKKKKNTTTDLAGPHAFNEQGHGYNGTL